MADLKLFIIDAISPFFIKHPETSINWSKIPFDQIETKGKLKKKSYLRIKKDFATFIDRVSAIGYNAISIDDLCHLAILDIYNPKLKKKIKKYKKRYRKLFKYARDKGLKIFITTDIMFFNEDIRKVTGNKLAKITQIMTEVLIDVFVQVPEVDGIIFRMGESDGVDVSGDFISEIVMETSDDVGGFLQALLPVFEQYNKLLIFRTWTIGVNQVGDLMWNQKTYNQAFAQINSSQFIISLKHGDGDFFRFLELNPLFFQDKKHAKILEIQTRREYEGFGQIPNFVGWEYERLAQQLHESDSLVGINVWCQTGGWSRARNFSFLERSSFFNELNTFVVLRIFQGRKPVEDAVAEFCPEKPREILLKFLRLADEVIEQLLYEPTFAKQQLYFNRVRIPPLFYIFWHYVTLTGPIIAMFRLYVQEPENALHQAQLAFAKIKQMDILNQDLGIPYDHQYYQDTFELLLLCRTIMYQDNQQVLQVLCSKSQDYSGKYPDAYHFSVSLPSAFSSAVLRRLIPIFVRRQAEYRWFDRFLFNSFTRLQYRLLRGLLVGKLPDFVDTKAMPLEKLLR